MTMTTYSKTQRKFADWFSSLPYWFRGGIFGVVILAFGVLGDWGWEVIFGKDCGGILCFTPPGKFMLILSIPLLYVGYEIAYLFIDNVSHSIELVGFIVYWFLLGALVGWSYGIIKSKWDETTVTPI